jgi:hypothetical protein
LKRRDAIDNGNHDAASSVFRRDAVHRSIRRRANRRISR